MLSCRADHLSIPQRSYLPQIPPQNCWFIQHGLHYRRKKNVNIFCGQKEIKELREGRHEGRGRGPRSTNTPLLIYN